MIIVDRVAVGRDRVRARVRVPAEILRTSLAPGFAGRALELLPGLARHTCECGSAHGIEAELADTETAHAIEHLAFELMALSGSPRSLNGVTTWDFGRDGRGVFEVALEYDDDLVALGALKEAVPIAEWLFEPAGQAPDVDAIVARLRDLRAN